MSTTQLAELELSENSRGASLTTHGLASDIHRDELDVPASAVDAIPDGGYGWTVVVACSVVTFMINGWSGSWGVLQTALFQAYPNQLSTTTLSFVGSLNMALCVGLGMFSVRLSQATGARFGVLLGVSLMGLGSLLSSFTVDNVGGLFATAGLSYGLGSCLTYTAGTVLPIQWFSTKLGTANGIVKLGGGLGATIMAVVMQALIDNVGIPWTFRIMGFLTFATGVPAALLIKERAPSTSVPLVDLSLFKSLRFCCLFVAGALVTFALYVPSFFLPLFAHSIGLSPSTGAGIVAGFNACTAIGRLGAGFACDKFGSTNVLFLTMVLNAVSMLAIWPVSATIGPLIVFVGINGIANGAFYVAMPTAISRMIGPGRASVAIGMALAGWSGGCFMGSPIAGIIISATGADTARRIEPYRAAIFYAGGIASASAACVLVARLRMDSKLIKKI